MLPNVVNKRTNNTQVTDVTSTKMAIGAQGRINLFGQSVLRFGGASTIFTVKTDDLFSRRCFNTL